MIVLAENFRYEDHFRATVAEDVAKLAFSIDWRDRVDDEPRHPRRQCNDRSLGPVGQLQRDDVAWVQPARAKVSGKAQRALPRLGAGQPRFAFDQKDPVGVVGHRRARRVDKRCITPSARYRAVAAADERTDRPLGSVRMVQIMPVPSAFRHRPWWSWPPAAERQWPSSARGRHGAGRRVYQPARPVPPPRHAIRSICHADICGNCP